MEADERSIPDEVIDEVTEYLGIAPRNDIIAALTSPIKGTRHERDLVRIVRSTTMVALRERGWTLHEIGTQLGLTRERVRQVLNSVLDKDKVAQFVSDRHAIVIADDLLKHSEWTFQQIADRRGIAIATVLRLVPDPVIHDRVQKAYKSLDTNNLTLAALESATGVPATRLRAELTAQQFALMMTEAPTRSYQRFSDNELVAALQAAATSITYLTVTNYEQWHSKQDTLYPSHTLVVRRFRSWNNALIAAGIPINRRGGRRTWWTDQRKIEAVAYYLQHEGAQGTARDYRRWRDEQAPAAPSISLLVYGDTKWNEIRHAAANATVSADVRKRLESGAEFQFVGKSKHSDRDALAARNDELVKEWMEGASIRELVVRYNLSDARIRQIIAKKESK